MPAESSLEKRVEEVALEAETALTTAVHVVEERVSQAALSLEDDLSAVAQKVEDQVHAAEEAMEKAGADVVEMVRKFLHGKIAIVVRAVTKAMPFIIKKVLDDPEMPSRAVKVKDQMVDVAWPEVERQIVLEMENGLVDLRDALKEMAGQPVDDEEKPARCCLLAFIRYHLYPYDRGLWGMSTDPFWLLAVTLAVIPIFGASCYLFLIVFFVIDKTDEYQLLFFIVQVKGFQFVSNGILSVYLSFFEFMRCALDVGLRCQDKALGGGYSTFMDAIAYVLCFLLLLAAYIMVYVRSRKRPPRDPFVEDIPSKFKGGIMVYLIAYDLVLTLTGLGVMTAVLGLSDWDFTSEQVGYAAEAVKAVHGLLMLPFFVLLMVPVIRNVVLHSRPTAYDRKGNCRNYVGPGRQVPKATDLIPQIDLLSPEEAQEFLQNMKKRMLGGAASWTQKSETKRT